MGRKQFNKPLGDYDAVSDVPAVVFSDELLVAHSDAKVLLTVPTQTSGSLRCRVSSIWPIHGRRGTGSRHTTPLSAFGAAAMAGVKMPLWASGTPVVETSSLSNA